MAEKGSTQQIGQNFGWQRGNVRRVDLVAGALLGAAVVLGVIGMITGASGLFIAAAVAGSLGLMCVFLAISRRRFESWAATAVRAIAVIRDVEVGQTDPNEDDSTVTTLTVAVTLPDAEPYEAVNNLDGYHDAEIGETYFCLVDQNDKKKIAVLLQEPAPADMDKALAMIRETG